MPEGEENERTKKALMKRLQEQQLEAQRREVLRRFLTPEAYERMANVRISNPELYSRLVELVVAMAQSNRLATKITDAQIRDLLSRLTSKQEPSIQFRHK
ncbi:MAG: hypothetical protein KGH59_03790 [Candidatus Micrarchaeota archaeon]|nr:hypothetical protein [Candidatus Micrarchaeota archaeon]MDE1804875.1 hypothetical protein [Candidatus Micrarchaeota archaeon]MDE1847163.1 hypothetical protein [Candidatus Micrarchaeota archaeon]